ncbi:MAG: LuxR C-terminal-related transcriptional regulator [Saprospiraceae bacterium]
MADIKSFLKFHKATIVYSICLALLLFLLKWLELRFIIFDYSLEIYIGFIACIFTALGIWLALKLSKPKIKTIVVEKEVYISRNKDFVLNESLVTKLELSSRELEIAGLMAEGNSNQEIANRLFISLSTVKTHNQNLFEKLDVKRRTQAIEKAKRLNLIP